MSKVFVYLVLFVFFAPAASAQSLTIDDALRLARQSNPGFRRVLNDAIVADANVRASKGALLPAVSADVRFSGYSSSRVTGENDYGQPVKLPEAIDFKGSSAQQGVGLTMMLFDGGATFRDISARRAAASAVDARIAADAARLDGEVKRQYYAALRASRMIAVEKQLLVSAKERLERTERLLRVAGSSPVDVLGARADAASQEQQLLRAENEARKQLLVLKEILGMQGDTDLQLTSDVPPVLDPGAMSLGQILALALQNSPLVREADASARAASKRASIAKAARLPTISANASYGRSMSLSSYDALFELNPQNRGFNFGVSASVPLFSNFRTSLQIAEAESNEADARESSRETRLRVERQVRGALLDVQGSFRQLQLAEQKAALSRERLDLAQEQYRNGAMTFTELQNVIDRTAEAERQVVDARFSYANALVYLEEYSGFPLTANR